MTIEQDYYENGEFWIHGALLPEDLARMEFIVRAIPTDARSLLDVGCGNGAFLEHLRVSRPDIEILHGAERSGAALQHVAVPHTQASIDSLPFPDQSFDCVTCLEVIEHLPTPIYTRALLELMRVSRRYLIVTVPREQDLTLGQVQCTVCKTLFNPDYHLRSFDQRSMIELFGAGPFLPRGVSAFGDGTEYAFSRLITRLKRDRGNRFPQDIPCPACGTKLKGRPGAQMTPVTRSGGGVTSTIKALWPKRREQRWLLARYDRITA
ncbi:MAG: class I SAM-dependent methyltransferase [Steroidobacteraceae bacterium]